MNQPATLTFRNRVPKDFFVTSGVGQSELTVHAGSFHFALHEAGIDRANIMTYSSILPAIANEVERSSATVVHGEVMESIMASQSARYGETATAGIIWGWLYDGDTKVGGLVCEYSGSMPEAAAREHLREMITDLHSGTFSGMRLDDVRQVVRSITPKQMYGTALVALCFTSHEFTEA